MEIALIIMGGVTLMTLIASGFDFLTKRRNKLDNATRVKVEELERKVTLLESMVNERNEKISQLEHEVSFVSRLIEKDK